MGKTLTYPKVSRTTLHRKPQRGTYDLETIHTIVNETPVLHVSFASEDASDPFPRIVPMIGVMGSFARPSADVDEPLDCYLHGYVSAGLMKAGRNHPEGGIPLTIAATKVDGIVLSLTPNNHSYNYRSAVLFGYGTLVEDVEEKLWAMELVTDSVVPDRWNETRIPPDAGEMASTSILRVRVVNGSGKIRTGPPGDEKKDIERADVCDRVWTGVLPIYETVGEPVRAGHGRLPDVPTHVQRFVMMKNDFGKTYATKDALEV